MHPTLPHAPHAAPCTLLSPRSWLAHTCRSWCMGRRGRSDLHGRMGAWEHGCIGARGEHARFGRQASSNAHKARGIHRNPDVLIGTTQVCYAATYPPHLSHVLCIRWPSLITAAGSHLRVMQQAVVACRWCRQSWLQLFNYLQAPPLETLLNTILMVDWDACICLGLNDTLVPLAPATLVSV